MKDKFKKIIRTIVNKVKKYTSKEYIKENPNKVVLGILIFIFLVATITYLCITRSVSNLEYELVKNNSDKYVYYLEDIDSYDSDLEDFIIFSLDYSYYENSKSSMNTKEMSSFINDVFDKDFKESDLEDYGVSEKMVKKNITYDNSNKSYSISKKFDAKNVDKEKVSFYRLDKMRKSSKSTFKVTYSKYTVEDPFTILNYYIEKGSNPEDNVELIDLNLLKEYLSSGNIKSLNEFLNTNSKDISDYANKDGSITIKYELVNENHIRIIDID